MIIYILKSWFLTPDKSKYCDADDQADNREAAADNGDNVKHGIQKLLRDELI